MPAPKLPVTDEQQPEEAHQRSFPRFFYLQNFYQPRPVQGISLSGKTAIVTGSAYGLGFETCRQLVNLGISRLILGVRDTTKGEEAATCLRGLVITEDNGPEISVVVEVWSLDQSSYDSVQAFATRAGRELARLDYVNLNAATAPGTRAFNASTGHDEVVQVNYLSTALLAILLLGVVGEKRAIATKKATSEQHELLPPAKITFTSSDLPAFTTTFAEKDSGQPLLEELDKPDDNVDMQDRMVVSKLLCQFLVRALARRVSPAVAIINAATPSGLSDSAMMADHRGLAGAMNRFMMRCIGRPSAAGAVMMVDALVARGAETHGKFLSFQEVTRMAPILYTPEGEEISHRLWTETMDEIGFVKPEDILRTVTG